MRTSLFGRLMTGWLHLPWWIPSSELIPDPVEDPVAVGYALVTEFTMHDPAAMMAQNALA